MLGNELIIKEPIFNLILPVGSVEWFYLFTVMTSPNMKGMTMVYV
jgi:hypothetical protein